MINKAANLLAKAKESGFKKNLEK